LEKFEAGSVHSYSVRTAEIRERGDWRQMRIQLVPFNQFSWWNKYQFTPVWAASVGLIYFSDSFASSDDGVKLPGFFRVDAGVFTKINETWRAQFNIENVFNKGYWASADGNNDITPGQPRTVRLTAFAKF
jgi:catecholate siderophore receptor